MLYISLILIAAGIFFIIYTLLIKTKKEPDIPGIKKVYRPVEVPLKNKKPERLDKKSVIDGYNNKSVEEPGNLSSGIDTLHDIADIKVNEETAKDLFKDSYREAAERKDIERDVTTEKDTDNRTADVFPAVLYEDSSNIIDYDNNDSTIDLTLNEYSKIKRVSAGHIEIAKDGINFRAGKKLFRFDYHQIANIKTGSNFIVLSIKKSISSRLFLFKNNPDLSARAKQTYSNFSANVFHL